MLNDIINKDLEINNLQGELSANEVKAIPFASQKSCLESSKEAQLVDLLRKVGTLEAEINIQNQESLRLASMIKEMEDEKHKYIETLETKDQEIQKLLSNINTDKTYIPVIQSKKADEKYPNSNKKIIL